MWSLHGMGERAFIQMVEVTTHMAIMSIYGKNFKNLLLRNQKASDLETWYAALVASTTKFVQMMTLG